MLKAIRLAARHRDAGFVWFRSTSTYHTLESSASRLVSFRTSRRLCTSPKTIPESKGEKPMSMTKKVALFSTFLVLGGGATMFYMVNTDPDFLFKLRDFSPVMVNYISPLLGMPVEEFSDDGGGENFIPKAIEDIVGNSLKVVCTLRSGRVVLLDANANSSTEELEKQLKQQVETLNDPIVQVDFVNEEEVARLEAKSTEELRKEFGIRIPEIPEGASKKQLKDILDQCRFLEADLTVQKELSKKYNNDITQIERALIETEERKKEIKKLLKGR